MAQTEKYKFELPDRERNLSDEIPEIGRNFEKADAALALQAQNINARALKEHMHGVADIEGLQAALDSKAPKSEKMTFAELADVFGYKEAALGYVAVKTDKGIELRSPQAAIGDHKHKVSDIIGLKEQLDYIKNEADRRNKDNDWSGNNFFHGESRFNGSVTGILPPGMIAPFAMAEAPKGWLKCNGSWISQKDYPALFAAIGGRWGLGKEGTFRLPDLRGEFIRGLLEDRDPGQIGSLKTQKGRALGSVEEMMLPWHSHQGVSDWGGDHSHPMNIEGGGYRPKGDGWTPEWMKNGGGWWTGSSGGHNHHFTTDGGIQTTWGLFGDEARPRNMALVFCIKF